MYKRFNRVSETFQPRDRRATIKDVSRVARVSVATVSNVLNAPQVVAPETRQRVSSVIDQLGYHPNRAARGLQKQRTFFFGYRMPPETDGFALDAFLHRMVERAGEEDLDIVLFTPNPDQSELDAYQEMIRRGAVDGFVISGTGHGDERIHFLLERGFPFVTFGRTDVADQHPWVDIDGRSGIEEAVGHLTAQGHRDIALIRWPTGSISGDERAMGYELGLREAGIPVRESLIVTAENNVTSGAAAMARLLEMPTPPTAVIAVQDLIALGAMATIRDAGLRCGDDIAVAGFDDIPGAATAAPPLTSVRQPMKEVGRLVIELLLRRLADPAGAPQSAMVVPELVVRESSRIASR